MRKHSENVVLTSTSLRTSVGRTYGLRLIQYSFLVLFTDSIYDVIGLVFAVIVYNLYILNSHEFRLIEL